MSVTERSGYAQNEFQHGICVKTPSTLAYQNILAEVEGILPYPVIRALLAESATMCADSLLHPLRVYLHINYIAKKIYATNLIGSMEYDKTVHQSSMAILHDIGKKFVAATPEESDRIMKGSTYSPTQDLRTPLEQSQMAIHAPAGAFALETAQKEGVLTDMPGDVFNIIKDGMLRHHSKPTSTVSGRGRTISYMDPVFSPTDSMSMLTNLLMNISDVFDAMYYPRYDRNLGQGEIPKKIIYQEIIGLIPNERIEAVFNCAPGDAEKVKLEVAKIVMEPIPEANHLINLPKLDELTWNGGPFIKPQDKELLLLKDLGAKVWEKEGSVLNNIKEELTYQYSEIGKI